ncbi:hypothetical protein [Tissierella pigra]|uniref:Uncharacterized protein n=2 Tax=Tissierella pigra TaxID=2607614 RepID=A0A6N7XWS5_9FIRM|nr:hypothetical protein [Tissierella pigra]MSU00935.1 hypothetical protein [Tissierella pigra]
MYNFKRSTSFILVCIILLSNSFISHASSEKIESHNTQRILKIIEDNNMEIVEDAHNIPEDTIVFDTVEEFEEFIENFNKLKEEVKITIEDNNILTESYNQELNYTLYNVREQTASVTIELPFPQPNLIHRVWFDHYSSGSFYACERYNDGELYLSGFAPATTLSRPSSDGSVRNGTLFVTGRGTLDTNLLVGGLLTVKKDPFRTSFRVEPNLKVTDPRIVWEK